MVLGTSTKAPAPAGPPPPRHSSVAAFPRSSAAPVESPDFLRHGLRTPDGQARRSFNHWHIMRRLCCRWKLLIDPSPSLGQYQAHACVRKGLRPPTCMVCSDPAVSSAAADLRVHWMGVTGRREGCICDAQTHTCTLRPTPHAFGKARSRAPGSRPLADWHHGVRRTKSPLSFASSPVERTRAMYG